LPNTKFFERFLQRGEQSICVFTGAERDAHASFAPMVARAVANQNAAPSHMLDE
jgi:predicted Rossmann-fold nucleotide-binding protein